MLRRRVLSVPFALALALLGLAPLTARAQDATPTAAPPGLPPGATIVASGLINPRGFTWGPDGTLYVAQAGNGGTGQATETAPTTQILGPFHGGPSASVVKIVGGCPVVVAGGLPSTADALGEALGAESVAFLDGQMYVSVDGGGPVHGNPDNPSGVYRVLPNGTTELVADLSAWVRANPVANVPQDHDPDAAGYSIVAMESAGALWVVDPNSGQILQVTPDGTVTRIVDLSAGHPVPTQMAVDPQGGVFVGTLTAAPFPEGGAKVMHVAADGTVTDVWTGLTAVTAVAVGPDGTLYASELSTGNLSQPPFLVPGSGKVVHQIPTGNEEVVTGLLLPVGLGFGPDGALYVSVPAIGANNGEGMILRFDLGIATPAAPAAPTACPPPASPVAGTPVG